MKEVWITYLLWWFLGYLGVHKFYLEQWGMGIFYALTCGGFGIGWLIDLFTIPKQVEHANLLLSAKRDDIHYKPKYIPQERVKVGSQTQDSAFKKPITKVEKENQILNKAKKLGGKVTPVEIASETGFSIDESKKMLDNFVKQGYVSNEITQSGVILYVFPGFVSEQDKYDAEQF